MAGFVVQNLSKQGEKFISAIGETGSVVYVVFFATAGAHLDVPLLRALWPVALALAATRALITLVRRPPRQPRSPDDPPRVKKWGWSGLVSQAGLALGLGGRHRARFPRFGDGFRALAIATVALNEMVGPVLFKFALDRTGETSTAPEPVRPSIGSSGGAPRIERRPPSPRRPAPARGAAR